MIGNNNNFWDTPVGYAKGVGPQRAEILKKELQIFTFGDLLMQFPFRYVDKTTFTKVKDLTPDSDYVQLRGILRQLHTAGEGRKKRLIGKFRDETGLIELVWFKGVNYLEKQLLIGKEYIVYGKINAFQSALNIPHPEMDPVTDAITVAASSFEPVYSSTEKLNNKGLDPKGRRKIIKPILDQLTAAIVPENLPDYLIQQLKLPARHTAIQHIHFPINQNSLNQAKRRLIFEELFLLQLRLLRIKRRRKEDSKGFRFEKVGDHFLTFYHKKLPFNLTDAQKRVIKEIHRDTRTGKQMNRLLQGDVGSGKTVVSLMNMLLALDNGFQACMMAPTEILAQQHFQSISEYLEGMEVAVGFLSGSVKGKKRKEILEKLQNGELHILIGTHALIEEWVIFQNLGIVIIDEQHRFGVEQRAKLWKKSKEHPPHVLVMTATPIPRTLSMTLYGDLDSSIIDELPPGRKPITTLHYNENHRLKVLGFMQKEIALGRQIYVVYPLIEESETLDLQNLEEGYEALQRAFPRPQYQISVVHGRMKPADKDFEMQRFVKGETQIMVATTVIEVGVNVPNASVMVIENTERFGLSQLHQLRGRVGRGAEQSYCLLMSSFKLSAEARERIQTMCRTNDGFEIAEADMRLRGPGNIEGTQQSGMVNLKIADLARDGKILQIARDMAKRILESDPQLQHPQHHQLKIFLDTHFKKQKGWSRIS